MTPQPPPALADDPHEIERFSRLVPADWSNPAPKELYDLLVIGGGPAGLVCASGAAAVGARVALVEKHLLGGDCLNTGCVPSKALLSSAHACKSVRDAGDYGVRVPEGVTVDFPAVMTRMRRLRAGISRHDGAARFRDMGIDVFLGSGRFTSHNTFDLNGAALRFRKAVIATGSRASLPPVTGLADARPLTSETLFDLTQLPPRLVVLGAGPIGCEMAQAFARFGARVTLVELAPRILPRDHPDASRIVRDALREDGVDVLEGTTAVSVARRGDLTVVTVEDSNGTRNIEADAVLVAAGRRANVEDLGLDVAGVSLTETRHVHVDDTLRTTNPRIYAAGDVCTRAGFTHSADAMARAVVRNAFFPGSQKTGSMLIPWCTYTDPGVAHVGMTQEEARAQGGRTFTVDLVDMDRSILEGETAGFVTMHVAAKKDRILGATVVAPKAGDLISEIAVAMSNAVGLVALGAVIRPYPTVSEAIRRVADQMNRTKLTPRTTRMLAAWMALGRRFRP